jgi:large subunit ribosomal protein L24
VEFPEFIIANEPDKRPYRSRPIPVPLDDVRLVVPLEDPETGGIKDVIVKHLRAGGPFLTPEYGSSTPRHTRYIAGADIEIPWPATEQREETDEDVDTLRIDVEPRTYLPSITEVPFPLSVIDELRNKFSKFRVRHDPDWLAEKQWDDAYREWQSSRKLLTPKTEFYERKTAEKQKQLEALRDEEGNPKLSEETASFIEQFMSSQGVAQGQQQKRKNKQKVVEADD